MFIEEQILNKMLHKNKEIFSVFSSNMKLSKRPFGSNEKGNVLDVNRMFSYVLS